MGGGPSKPKSNKLLASVPFCKFSKIDTIYDRVNKALKSAEDVRVGVEESKLKAIELAKTNWVKGDEDLRFLEAVKILLWTVSGENGGKILSVNPRGSNEPPALELMFQAKKQETNNLYQNATSFIRAGANAKVIKEATVELEKAIKETASGSAQIKKEGKAAGMDAKAQAAAIKVVQSNTKLLKVEVLKLKSIQTAADKAVTCLKKIRVGDLISPNHIDDTGKKISTESGNTFKTPAEIFDKYYTGAKLTQKEFDAEKSGKKAAPSKGNDKNTPQKQATQGPAQNQAGQNNTTNAGQPNNNQPNNQNSNQQGAPNQNITNNQNQSYGDSPFKNQQGGNNTMQNTPQKGKIQDEDIWDDEENKGPIIKNVQDSNLLHQSSIKRQKYIKPIV